MRFLTHSTAWAREHFSAVVGRRRPEVPISSYTRTCSFIHVWDVPLALDQPELAPLQRPCAYAHAALPRVEGIIHSNARRFSSVVHGSSKVVGRRSRSHKLAFFVLVSRISSCPESSRAHAFWR